MNIFPNFDHSKSFKEPYRHAWIPRLFPAALTIRILQWLERDLPWKLTVTEFYQQFEFSLAEVNLPSNLSFLSSTGTMSALGHWVCEEFGTSDVKPVDIVAHLLEPGHDIGIHNDYRPNGETHRLLLQLGRKSKGGITALFRDRTVESICRLIHPIHGTAYAFEISEDSYHAVSKVQDGQRFSLVYSFRARS